MQGAKYALAPPGMNLYNSVHLVATSLPANTDSQVH